MGKQESLRVAVLMGGRSAEREISLASGICVAAALEEAGHQPFAIDPAEVDLRHVDWRRFDSCFLALHGGEGEDGRVQRLLDSLRVSYTGSGPQASHLAMSKSAAKERFRQWRLPTPPSATLATSEPISEMLSRCSSLGYPVVLKPDNQGSSLGVNLVCNDEDFQRAVAEIHFFGEELLAEKFIAGREFTVAVIDDQTLPALEVLSSHILFDYEGKYHDTGTEYSFDHQLTALDLWRIERTALLATKSLGTTGLARVDLRLDEYGAPWLLEVNTIPGMTEHSLVPRIAAQAGIDMPALCDRLVRASLPAAVQRA